MKPIYINNYIKEDLFDVLRSEVEWINKDAPRDECFMSPVPLEYTYGKGVTRTYRSLEMLAPPATTKAPVPVPDCLVLPT